MKKVLFLLVLVVLGIYGVGRLKLGEAGAMRFLAEMDSMMSNGKGQEICEMFHEDLEIDISDQTGESPLHVSGGKQKFCEMTVVASASLNVLPHSMTVDFTDVETKQDWLHPWTSEVSYLENRSLSIHGSNVTIRTVSDDEITLVHTFSGVKLRKLKSEVYKADAT
jgi:hypothetical protein